MDPSTQIQTLLSDLEAARVMFDCRELDVRQWQHEQNHVIATIDSYRRAGVISHTSAVRYEAQWRGIVSGEDMPSQPLLSDTWCPVEVA